MDARSIAAAPKKQVRSTLSRVSRLAIHIAGPLLVPFLLDQAFLHNSTLARYSLVFLVVFVGVGVVYATYKFFQELDATVRMIAAMAAIAVVS